MCNNRACPVSQHGETTLPAGPVFLAPKERQHFPSHLWCLQPRPGQCWGLASPRTPWQRTAALALAPSPQRPERYISCRRAAQATALLWARLFAANNARQTPSCLPAGPQFTACRSLPVAIRACHTPQCAFCLLCSWPHWPSKLRACGISERKVKPQFVSRQSATLQRQSHQQGARNQTWCCMSARVAAWRKRHVHFLHKKSFSCHSSQLHLRLALLTACVGLEGIWLYSSTDYVRVKRQATARRPDARRIAGEWIIRHSCNASCLVVRAKHQKYHGVCRNTRLAALTRRTAVRTRRDIRGSLRRRSVPQVCRGSLFSVQLTLQNYFAVIKQRCHAGALPQPRAAPPTSPAWSFRPGQAQPASPVPLRAQRPAAEPRPAQATEGVSPRASSGSANGALAGSGLHGASVAQAWTNPLYRAAPGQGGEGAVQQGAAWSTGASTGGARPEPGPGVRAFARPASAPAVAAAPPPGKSASAGPDALPYASTARARSASARPCGNPGLGSGKPSEDPRGAGALVVPEGSRVLGLACGDAAPPTPRQLLTPVLPSADEAALHAAVSHLRAALRGAELRLADAQGEVYRL